jgi:hypothetical protein
MEQKMEASSVITTVLKSPIEKGLQSGQRLFIERGSEWKRWDLHMKLRKKGKVILG